MQNIETNDNRSEHKTISDILDMPYLQLFCSPVCNLNCKYCSNRKRKQQGEGENKDFNFLKSKDLHNFIKNIPPTHLYVSGGEPLIHPGIKEFVLMAGESGHKISFDTNFSLSRNRLYELFTAWDPEYIGFVNISHHLVCNISFKDMEKRVTMLKDMSFPHFVKYVGVPELRFDIEKYLNRWKENKTGAAVTVLQGKWNGRTLPENYTSKEVLHFLKMITLNTHGLQFFGGIKSFGLQCRGGNDFLCYNMLNKREFIPCCHGEPYPRDIHKTYFFTKEKRKLFCPIDFCVGDIMLIAGINGIMDEKKCFENICNGEYTFIGADGFFEYIQMIQNDGFEICDGQKLVDIKNAYSANPFPTIKNAVEHAKLKLSKPSHTLKRVKMKVSRMLYRPDTNMLMAKKTAGEKLDYLEAFVSRWNRPESVISSKKHLRPILVNELKNAPDLDDKTLVRFLAKKVAQYRYSLPLKINVEVASICPLRCDYCVLADLQSYRRKKLMGYEDFLRVWKFMEVFTTEVEFTGGEPLMNQHVFDMIKKTRETGVKSTLTTNASLLTENKILNILDARPTNILIAYDSSDPETYESTRKKGKANKLVDNVKTMIRLKKERGLHFPNIILQMVIHKKNQYDAQDFLQEARQIGADVANLKPVFMWPGESGEYEKMMLDKYLIPGHPMSYYRLDDNGNLMNTREPGVCPNMQHVHIGSGSEVIPCWYILKNTYVAGYAADTPFFDIWYSDEYLAYRRQMKEGTVNKGCSKCIGMYNPALWKSYRLKNKDKLCTTEIS